MTHIHSLYSDGTESLDAVAERAHEKGIDVLIPTDTLIADADFGLWPLRGLIHKSAARRSVLSIGADKYLADIRALRRKYPDMLIIPGVEAAAYYRWEGRPWRHLTLVDWNRHMLILGLEKPEDYERIPVVGNAAGGDFDPLLLWPAGLWVMALAAGYLRRRGWALGLAALGIVFMANNRPFRSLPDSPYDSETPWSAYQRLIDYARGRGAVVVWAHPDAPNWEKDAPVSSKVSMLTRAYPDAVLRSAGFQGFGIFMEGLRRTGVPGGAWDQALRLYLQGRRERPIWAFAELDYHGPERDLDLQSAQMVLDARSKSAAGVLDAMREGRFYSIRPDFFAPMVLRQWTLSEGGRWAASGRTLKGSCRPEIDLDLAYADGSSHAATVRVIRDGQVIASDRQVLPHRWSFSDPDNESSRSFYRVLVQDEQLGWLATNPIFCEEKK